MPAAITDRSVARRYRRTLSRQIAAETASSEY
jgi:hypothetical protein